MTELVAIVPTRGRPDAARELAEAFAETCTADTVLYFAVDTDDPTGDEGYGPLADGARVRVGYADAGSMVEALNFAASRIVADGLGGIVSVANEPHPTPFALGFLGDDHRPRTVGWDRAYIDALAELGTGMVYGDDQLQGANLPTQIAMTADIVRALGWMAPPDLVHLAVDNWWLELGRTAGCIRYLPDVIVEHMHPVAGKSEWTEGHQRVNAPAMYQRDLAMLARLRVTEMPRAVAAVKALRDTR